MPGATPVDAERDAQHQRRRARDAVRRLSLAVDAHVRAVARRVGHGAADMHALGAVKHSRDDQQELSARDLGRALALSPAAVTALVDRMVEAGYVTRERSTLDARRVHLVLTECGEAESVGRFAAMNQAYEQVLGRYSQEQLALVVEVLRELTAATEQATEDGVRRAPGEPAV